MANSEIYSISTISQMWGADESTTTYILNKYRIPEITPGYFSILEIENKESELPDGIDTLYDAFNVSMDELFKTINKNVEELGLGNQINVLENEYESLIAKITGLKEKDDPELDELIRENEELLEEIKEDLEEIKDEANALEIETDEEIDYVKKDRDREKLKEKINKSKASLEYQDKHNQDYLLNNSSEDYIKTYENAASDLDYNQSDTYDRERDIAEEIFRKSEPEQYGYKQQSEYNHQQNLSNDYNYSDYSESNKQKESASQDSYRENYFSSQSYEDERSREARQQEKRYEEQRTSEYDRMKQEEVLRSYSEEQTQTQWHEQKRKIELDKVEDSGYKESNFYKSFKENQENISTYRPAEMAVPVASGYSLSENDNYRYYVHGGREAYTASIARMAIVEADETGYKKDVHVVSKQEDGKYKVETVNVNQPDHESRLHGINPSNESTDQNRIYSGFDEKDIGQKLNSYREQTNDLRSPLYGVDIVAVEKSKETTHDNKRNIDENSSNTKIVNDKSIIKDKSDDAAYNILKTDNLKRSVNEWRDALMNASGVNQSDAVKGYNRTKIGIDATVAVGSVGAAAAYNLIAVRQFEKIDQNAIKDILIKRSLINNRKDLNFNILNNDDLALTRKELGKVVGDFCKKENLKDFSKMSGEQLKRYIEKMNLTGDAKELAEATLKLGRIKFGFKKFNVLRKFRRLGQGAIKKVAGENDAVKSALIIKNVAKASKDARKSVRNVGKNASKLVTKTRGLIQSNKVELAKAWNQRTPKLNRHGKYSRIRNNRTIFNIRHTGMNMRNRFAVTKAGKSISGVFRGAKTFGSALRAGNIKGALGILKTGASAIKLIAAKGIGAAAAVLAKPLVIAIAIISLIFCLMMCCLIGFTLMSGYTNNAFGTSNRLIKNVANLFDMTGATNAEYGEDDGSDETGLNEESGATSELEDSVGWFALKNDVGFYSVYEEVIDKYIEKRMKREGKRFQNATELDGNTALKDFIYNDLEVSSGEESPLGDKIVYYLSTQPLVSVLRNDDDDAVIGSDYPYYNSQEIISMASAKLQNSINPYNYRRFTRILRNYSYATETKWTGGVKGWFSDTFGWKTHAKEGNFKLNDAELYIEESPDEALDDLNFNSVNSILDTFNEDKYNENKEIIYVGYRYLTSSEMTHFGHSSFRNIFRTIYVELEPYSEDKEKELLEEFEKELIEEDKCDNFILEATGYIDNYEPPQEDVPTGEYRDILDEEGNIIGQEEITKDIPASGGTTYSFIARCKGHKTLQTYVRCATLKGIRNLYDLDDECESTESMFTEIKKLMFPDLNYKWSDDVNAPANSEKRSTVIELKSEAESMAADNWPLTYGIDWKKCFEQAGVADYYSEVGYRLSQGDGVMNEGDSRTPYGMVIDFIDKTKAKINTSTIIDNNTIQFKDGQIYTIDDVNRIHIVDKAVTYVGKVKYFYGGDIPNLGASDCSAFISEALGIGRTTTSGFVSDPSYPCYGQNYDAMKPGDLLVTIGEGRGSHVRMYTGLTVDIEGTKYYITVECSSGATTRFHSSDKVSGCSCGRYSASDLSGDGYQIYSIENHLDFPD